MAEATVTLDDLMAALTEVHEGRGKDLPWEMRGHLVIHGLAEECEQMKPCRECGTPRVDFRWWRVTPAGRLFIAAMDRPT